MALLIVPVWAAAADALVHRETEVSVLLFVGVFVCQCLGVCRCVRLSVPWCLSVCSSVSALVFAGVFVCQCPGVFQRVRVSALCCLVVCLCGSALLFVGVFVCQCCAVLVFVSVFVCPCPGQTDRRTETVRTTETTEMMTKPQLQQSQDSWHLYFTLGYFGVSIIHPAPTWTTGSLTCVNDLFARVHTRGTSVYSLTGKTVVESAQNLTAEKGQGGRTA